MQYLMFLIMLTMSALPRDGALSGRERERKTTCSGNFFVPVLPVDYGSGASIRTDWYSPGGLGGGIGVFVGHPNGLARGDRALVRFNLSPLLPKPVAESSRWTAVLRFRVSNFTGKVDRCVLEIVHLNYDPWTLTGNDLVNSKIEVVGTVTVTRKDFLNRIYSIDVTKHVREGLGRGDKFCGFRLRDINAEAKGNPDLAATGLVIAFDHLKNTPVLEVNETK